MCFITWQARLDIDITFRPPYGFILIQGGTNGSLVLVCKGERAKYWAAWWQLLLLHLISCRAAHLPQVLWLMMIPSENIQRFDVLMND